MVRIFLYDQQFKDFHGFNYMIRKPTNKTNGKMGTYIVFPRQTNLWGRDRTLKYVDVVRNTFKDFEPSNTIFDDFKTSIFFVEIHGLPKQERNRYFVSSGRSPIHVISGALKLRLGYRRNPWYFNFAQRMLTVCLFYLGGLLCLISDIHLAKLLEKTQYGKFQFLTSSLRKLRIC